MPPVQKARVSWLEALVQGNLREKRRLRDELANMRGAIELLMRVRNGGEWSSQDRAQLRNLLRAASNVSPYLVVMAMPGSLLFLPLLAWHLDMRRTRREDESRAQG